jgi:hypothetical protein
LDGFTDPTGDLIIQVVLGMQEVAIDAIDEGAVTRLDLREKGSAPNTAGQAIAEGKVVEDEFPPKGGVLVPVLEGLDLSGFAQDRPGMDGPSVTPDEPPLGGFHDVHWDRIILGGHPKTSGLGWSIFGARKDSW